MSADHEMREDCKLRFEQMDKHIQESAPIRDKVVKHDEIIKGITNLQRFWLATSVTLVGSLVSIAVIWGALLNRVDNLEKYTRFIMEHSYGVQEFMKGK